jgi:ABC-type multidrug transport system fused ATPase/permease subunit
MAETYRNANEPRVAARPADTSFTMVDEHGKVSVAAPVDRVRWSSVLAGLFTTLATLIVLAVLGIAIGLSTFDAQNLDNFGIGAGIYGAVSAIIAFLFGGFISARTAAVAGSGNGILNGAMVWLVTIPLIVNLLGSGIGTLLGTATDLVGDAAVAAGNAVGGAASAAVDAVSQNPALQATVAGGIEAGATAIANPNDPNAAVDPNATAIINPNDPNAAVDPNATVLPGQEPIATVAAGAQGAVQDAAAAVQSIDAEDVENVAQDLSGPAWGTLLALGLSALAAIFGGLMGKRSYPTDVAIIDRGVRTTTR